jgi:hypothetical protein
MKYVLRFFQDAGRWGLASELAALAALILAIWERTQNHKVPPVVFLIITALFFATGVFAAWYRATRKVEEIEASKPKIKLSLPGAAHCIQVFQGVGTKTIGGKDVQVQLMVPFLRVTFLNDPPASYPSAIAEGLRAYLRFYPVGQSVCTLRIPGRWAESNQPRGSDPYSSTAPLAETSLGLGESKTVDIAYISAMDGNCYAWNNDNYKFPYFQNPAHLLYEQGYEVHVRLRGKMVDKNFKLTFWIDRGHFRFTQPSKAPILEPCENTNNPDGSKAQGMTT